MIVGAAAALATAAPAAAHDELLASTPASGERLAAAPSEAALRFSADVLTIGAAVIVADGAGRDWTTGEPVVEAGTVTVALQPGMPVGGYELRWRVVSADGHPISGVVPFAVGDADFLHQTPSRGTDPSPAATTAPAEQSPSAPHDPGMLRILAVGVGGAIVAIAAYALFHVIRRKKDSSA